MADAPAPQAPTLLIVDDAADIAQLLVVFFHQRGFRALAAYDGRSALDLLRRAAPDLVLLDLGLPDIDGLELCRAIRGAAAAPVVMVTRRDSAEDRQRGLDAGAAAYLTKPFDAEELHGVVRSLLQRP